MYGALANDVSKHYALTGMAVRRSLSLGEAGGERDRVPDCGTRAVRATEGRMHDDLRKSMTDGMLKHSLFACFNTE